MKLPSRFDDGMILATMVIISALAMIVMSTGAIAWLIFR
jgi:hypothetical protein